jgi:hypothetical protein
MKRIVVAAALVFAIASPALAQSYDPDLGSGNLDAAAYATSRHTQVNNRTHPVRHRTVRRASPSEAYAQSPQAAFPGAPSFGYRWPGARYDAYGYYIDPNSPGRW